MANIQRAIDWLETAKYDLRVSKHAYSGNLHYGAIAPLQQSVEKGTKSLALALSIVEDEYFFNIKHDQLSIFTSLENDLNEIVNTTNIEYGSIVIDVLEKYNMIENFKLGKFTKQVSIFINKAKRDSCRRKLTYGELDKYLKEIETLNNIYLQTRFNLTYLTFSEQESIMIKKVLVDIIIELAKEIDPDNAILKEDPRVIEDRIDGVIVELINNGSIKRILIKLTDVVYSLIALFYLSVITQSHAKGKYNTPNFNPLTFYSDDLPFVKKLPIIIDNTEFTLNVLEKMYNGENVDLEVKPEAKVIDEHITIIRPFEPLRIN